MAAWKVCVFRQRGLTALGRFEIRHYDDIVMTTSLFLGRWSARNSGMPSWRDRLFIAPSRQAANATDFFAISDRGVELGAQVAV